MSSTTLPGGLTSTDEVTKPLANELSAGLLKAVRLLASLKLTCALFLLAMVIVFVGSLAQSRRDVWQVMEQYFRTYIAWIDLRDLFPPSMFDRYGDNLAERLGSFRYIPFPGGWTIGWIMLANLIAAHGLKFKLRAEGGRLAGGIFLVVLGLVMTAGVVLTGNQQTGVEAGNTLLTSDQIWILLLGVLGLAGLASAITAAVSKSSSRLSRGVLFVVAAVLLSVLLYFVTGGEEARLNLSSMRILWQLLKGSACSVVLLMGSMMLFGKRGGIALLHFGVAMLMVSELQVGLLAKENMLSLVEGESSDFVRDIRERELAVIFHKDDKTDQVVVIPEKLLTEAAAAAAASDEDQNDESKQSGKHLIKLPTLPFDVAVRRFYRNSRLRALLPDDQLKTEAGLGSFAAPEELEPVTGMDDSNDQSSIYLDLIDRDSNEVIQSLLVAQNVSELRGAPLAEKVTVDGKDYQFYLRFQRNYRDYDVKLLDVSRTNYVGSATPRDYRSIIEIKDLQGSTTEKFTVWMNNPLRYKGETFYQSGYTPLEDGTEATTLSVVRNTGWMLPYIACMMVAFGMFAQFGQTLFRFLDRTERAAAGPKSVTSTNVVVTRPGFAPARAASVSEGGLLSDRARTPWIAGVGIPLVITLLLAAWIGSRIRTPKENPAAMNLYSFAELPIAWNGRAQPVDSVARTQLLSISHKSTFQGEMEAGELGSPTVREQLIEAFKKGWPDVSSASLEEFNGSYTQWIDQIARLTSSGREAVEERMRPLMVRRMPAVHWFLDVITRPEVAARHRVIKIEDDQVLSLLGLEKRGGMTYSLVEIQKNLKALEPLLKKALEQQRNKQENSMSTMERRVAALFETIRRVDTLSQMFTNREATSLLGATVDSWRILRLLGNDPAVMAVPTGASDEQRSWETFVASNAIRQLNAELKSRNITTFEQFVACLRDTLPPELVSESLIGSFRILKDAADDQGGAGNNPDAVRKSAAEAEARVEDRFLKQILAVLAASEPGATAEEIAASVTPEKAREIAAERISFELFEIFSVISDTDPNDKRLLEIRSRMQNLMTQDAAALSQAMNVELSKLVWDDLQKRAGHLLPGGECTDVFDANASSMAGILAAWKSGDVEKFNTGIKAYSEQLANQSLLHVDMPVVKTEAWFNYFEPFYKAICLYLPVLVLSFLGWLFFGTTLRRTALFLMVLAFALHTFALLLRMWISGRPPVTNLYSSAIFIGWAVVVASFIVELLVRNGIGNVIGASVGAATLMIAHYLARDEGDTLGVMQAVLDTAFWLATHVVCITLGYAATFLAGFLGFFQLCMVFAERASARRQSVTPALADGDSVSVKQLLLRAGARPRRMMSLFASRIEQSLRSPQFTASQMLGKLVYGTLCFALFFSLVGTVLGGLWADDSWGRFWGWDPKENGAMMIVIWNALIMHARWDKMVNEYGMSVLAMVGNIVTAWSWFGVNELKAGLHTYGFTEGRLLALGIFAAVQFGIVIVFALLALSNRKKAVNLAA